MKSLFALISGLLLCAYVAGEKMPNTVLQTQVDGATQQLKKLLHSNDPIQTVSAEKVTWRDSSLGCPRQELNYLQVLTPGVRIVLEVNDKQYVFHGNNKQPVFLCDSISRQQPYALDWQNAESDN